MKGGGRKKWTNTFYFAVRSAAIDYTSNHSVQLTLWRLGNKLDSPGLSPQALAGAVDPHVHALHILRQENERLVSTLLDRVLVPMTRDPSLISHSPWRAVAARGTGRWPFCWWSRCSTPSRRKRTCWSGASVRHWREEMRIFTQQSS